MASFVDRVLLLDGAGGVELHNALLQLSQQYGMAEVYSSIYVLLARLRLREAFILAMMLDKAGLGNPGISFSLGVGGLLLGRPAEEARGMGGWPVMWIVWVLNTRLFFATRW